PARDPADPGLLGGDRSGIERARRRPALDRVPDVAARGRGDPQERDGAARGKAMKRVLRWIGFAVAGVAGLAVIAYAVLYVLSEQALNRTYPVPAVTLSIPTDAESIQEGRRLATVRGCLPGCHGKAGEGEVMFDQPIVARVVAPNLTVAAKKFNAAELAGIIRNGVRPDGRSMLVMPSQTYAALTDQDLARIIAFLKTLQ